MKKLLVLLLILCGVVYFVLQKYLWFLQEYEFPVGWDK